MQCRLLSVSDTLLGASLPTLYHNLIPSFGYSLISYLINLKKKLYFLPEAAEVEFVFSGFQLPDEKC